MDPLDLSQKTILITGDAFVFLCSSMANYMTGSVLVVDGGCRLYPMD